MAVYAKVDCTDCSNYTGLIKRLLFFNKISQNILEKKPLSILLNEILNSSKLLLNAEASSLLLYNKENDVLYFHTVSGEKKKELTHKTIELGEGIAGWVAANKKVLKIDNCYEDDRFNKDFDIATGFKTRNMICAPMIRKKELVGVIQVINKKEDKLFDQQDVDLFKVLASECALAIENARLAEVEIITEQINYELSIAHNIQQKLLPSKLPIFSDIDVSTVLIPAKEVGGDYHNVIKISEDKTLFLIADVSGKSVPAALIVSTIYSFIQTYLIINKENLDLKQFVESLNRFLISATTTDKFSTAWFGLIDHKTKTMFSINAGHNPTYLYRSNESRLTTLNVGGLLLGSIDLPFEVETVSLEKDDVIVYYTDGIPEAMNKNAKEYGEERFEKLIKKNTTLPSTKILSKILADVKRFRGPAEQSDDITCGIIRVN